MHIRKQEGGIQYPIVYVLVMMVVVGAVTAGYIAKDGSLEGSERVVPGNYFNSEVRSGSQVIEISIIP